VNDNNPYEGISQWPATFRIRGPLFIKGLPRAARSHVLVHKIYVNTYYTSAYFPKACWNTRPYGILMYWLLLPCLEGLVAVGENSMSGP